jgi:transcriptional regulator with XRE-family HTH domain
MNTVYLPTCKWFFYRYYKKMVNSKNMRMTELKNVLARIEQRLKETGQKKTSASVAAGKPDAIRNIERAVKEGRYGTVTLETILALAHQLNVSPKWLLFGEPDTTTNEIDLSALLDAVEGTYSMLGLDQEESSALLKIAIEAAQEPPVPSAKPGYRRMIAEIEARKFLKLKQSGHDGA